VGGHGNISHNQDCSGCVLGAKQSGVGYHNVSMAVAVCCGLHNVVDTAWNRCPTGGATYQQLGRQQQQQQYGLCAWGKQPQILPLDLLAAGSKHTGSAVSKHLGSAGSKHTASAGSKYISCCGAYLGQVHEQPNKQGVAVRPNYSIPIHLFV
jgi:hypothetical protein